MSDDMYFDESCGNPGSNCTCYDCKTYFNPNTVRPVKGNNVSDEQFTEMIELCKKDNVIQRMKNERYRSYIYQIVPYPMWSLLNDPEKYQSIVDKLKSEQKIPDEDPEICSVDEAAELGLDDTEPKTLISISYRFPTSSVKYDISVYKDENSDMVRIRTHGRGSDYRN